VIDAGTCCRAETTPPGVLNPDPVLCDPRPEEVVPIVDYIVGEMNRNAASPEVARMREFNGFSMQQCVTDFQKLPWWKQLLGMGIRPEDCANTAVSYKAAALLGWAAMVRQDGPWDHKPYIRAHFHACVAHGEQVWHLHLTDRFLYYYDTWSNIHYGYVGKAAGFTDAELLDGAGLEQIGSDLLRGKLPKASPGVQGLRRFDDAPDRAAITIGIKLYQARRVGLSPMDVLREVETSPEVDKKPYR
jgi:hypothetical protein